MEELEQLRLQKVVSANESDIRSQLNRIFGGEPEAPASSAGVAPPPPVVPPPVVPPPVVPPPVAPPPVAPPVAPPPVPRAPPPTSRTGDDDIRALLTQLSTKMDSIEQRMVSSSSSQSRAPPSSLHVPPPLPRRAPARGPRRFQSVRPAEREKARQASFR